MARLVQTLAGVGSLTCAMRDLFNFWRPLIATLSASAAVD
jgi:hypothetical protein